MSQTTYTLPVELADYAPATWTPTLSDERHKAGIPIPVQARKQLGQKVGGRRTREVILPDGRLADVWASEVKA